MGRTIELGSDLWWNNLLSKNLSIRRYIDLHGEPYIGKDNRRMRLVGFTHTLFIFRYTCM